MPEDIREVQEKLRALSLNEGRLPEVSVDGVYGPLTSLAVSAFQQQEGLAVTGNVDFETWRALNEAYEETLFDQKQPERIAGLSCNLRIRQGQTGNEVLLLQTMLNFIGEKHYNIGGVEQNGRYDEQTTSAVREYQRTAGLPMTGEVDKATWDAIATLYNTFFEQVCD